MMTDLADMSRFSIGFYNPNHVAAMICALLPFCWGWRRARWLGWVLIVVLIGALAATQSRTGLVVMVLEVVTYDLLRKKDPCLFGLKPYRWSVIGGLVLSVAAFAWISPRLALDGSILNRSRIWLAGLQLFAANPMGVGLGNSGTVASAFLLQDIPETRTMISTHITLLAEFGWGVGVAWFAFVVWGLMNLRRSPRAGVAFAGLVLSGCSSTIFDWPVLFDATTYGGLGLTNWILSWIMFLVFVVLGLRLVVCGAAKASSRGLRQALVSGVVAASGVLFAVQVPHGDVPIVKDGYVRCGTSQRTLVLYDQSLTLRKVLPYVTGTAILPVHPVSRFPGNSLLEGVEKVVLYGTCREWAYLIKGAAVECAEDS